MTFGALATWQAWLLVIVAGAAAILLFLVKLRPPRVGVPSLLLWRRVLDESREQTLWERIRQAVSLVLTAIIAIALAFAVAQPQRRAANAAAGSGNRVLVVIDSSWSMLARTASGETRWERGVAQARRVLAAVADSDLALATTAEGLVEGPTSDRALVDAALERLSPAGGDAAAWPRLSGTSTVHFITDGAVPRPLDTDIIVHSVFDAAPNVAITAFGARSSLTSDHVGAAYLEVANYAGVAQPVRVILRSGAATLMDRRHDMAAGEVLRQALPVPRGADAALRAVVEARENALEVDDEAFAWLEAARPMRVTVVGEHTTWLATLFDGNPRMRATMVTPDAYVPDAERSDVIIFDRWSPSDVPAVPALYFAPPGDRGAEEQLPRWEQAGSHPVVRGVDPLTLTIQRARAYSGDALVATARSARGTPLVYVHESPDRRAVIVTFGPNESNLAAAPAFPVLIGNAIDWLTTPTARRDVRAGVAFFDNGVDTVSGPGGSRVALERIGDAAVARLRSPGLYLIQGGGARSALAVNAGDPQVSNLTRTTLSAVTQSNVVLPGGSRTPWWIYCTIAALLLALTEWWTWQRRITV